MFQLINSTPENSLSSLGAFRVAATVHPLHSIKSPLLRDGILMLKVCAKSNVTGWKHFSGKRVNLMQQNFQSIGCS